MQKDESLLVLRAVELPNKVLNEILTHKVENRLVDTVDKENIIEVHAENDVKLLKMQTCYLEYVKL